MKIFLLPLYFLMVILLEVKSDPYRNSLKRGTEKLYYLQLPTLNKSAKIRGGEVNLEDILYEISVRNRRKYRIYFRNFRCTKFSSSKVLVINISYIFEIFDSDCFNIVLDYIVVQN